MFSEKGQTLMELVVVVAISAIVVGALVFATIASLRNAQFSKNQAQATKLAQEGIEWVRLGRNKDSGITGGFNLSGNPVDNWQDPDLWTRIKGVCGTVSEFCYFNIRSNGELQHLTAQTDIPSGVETIGVFKRVVTLSDEPSTYDKQKTVAIIVEWTDFSGKHQSKLTTILGKLE